MIYIEYLYPWEAFWLTIVTLSTVGYGDISAQTQMGQIVTMLLLIIPGVIVISAILSRVIEIQTIKVNRKIFGKWNWKMDNHILIFNAPKNIEHFVTKLMQELSHDPQYKNSVVQIVSQDFPDGLPNLLRDNRVILYSSHPNAAGTLLNVTIEHALVAFVLAEDPSDTVSDAATFDLIHRIREANSDIYIVAETVSDDNRKRIRSIGANAIIRPIRSYPEIAARAVLAPGSELVIEQFFNHHGSEYNRIDIPEKRVQWGVFSSSIINMDLGTPIACFDDQGEIHINPCGSTFITIKSLILAMREGKNCSVEMVLKAIAKMT